MTFCSECGKKLPDSAQACLSCGTADTTEIRKRMYGARKELLDVCNSNANQTVTLIFTFGLLIFGEFTALNVTYDPGDVAMIHHFLYSVISATAVFGLFLVPTTIYWGRIADDILTTELTPVIKTDYVVSLYRLYRRRMGLLRTVSMLSWPVGAILAGITFIVVYSYNPIVHYLPYIGAGLVVILTIAAGVYFASELKNGGYRLKSKSDTLSNED